MSALLFSERGYKMYSRRRSVVEPGQRRWNAEWFDTHGGTFYGGASGYGTDSTPLEATENAWATLEVELGLPPIP